MPRDMLCSVFGTEILLKAVGPNYLKSKIIIYFFWPKGTKSIWKTLHSSIYKASNSENPEPPNHQ